MNDSLQSSEEWWRKFLNVYTVFKFGVVIAFIALLYAQVNKSPNQKEANMASLSAK